MVLLIQQGGFRLKRLLLLLFALLLPYSTSIAQSSVVTTAAAEIIQPSPSTVEVSSPAQRLSREVKLPAGTIIDVEVAYTVNSKDVRLGEQISFRVLIPIMVDGVAVIEKDALVTARVTRAKRGGHWGKAGRLTWSMEDVVAVDNTRIPLAPETAASADKLWSLENKPTNNGTRMGQGSVKGTSHTGEVAARTIISGVLFPPLALMNGFKRGGNAVLPEGRRFVVAVGKDTPVRVSAAP